LNGTDLAHQPFTVFQHARIEPFLDQVNDAPVGYPMLEKFHQPLVLQRIEGKHDTLPTSTIFQSASG
jgi:hypothetical protein